MDWILDKIPILIFVLVIGAKILSALAKSGKARQQHEAEHDESAEQRRVADVQREIRRRIAERRGGTATAPPTAAGAPWPRSLFPPAETTPAPDSMGDTLRRMLEQGERKIEPPAPVSEPPLISQRRAELEHQQRLADEMKALEETKMLATRRAVQAAANQKAADESEKGMLSAARGRVLDDLREPDALRRAFVLREVLGPPVGLR